MMEGPVRTVLVLACLLSVQPWLPARRCPTRRRSNGFRAPGGAGAPPVSAATSLVRAQLERQLQAVVGFLDDFELSALPLLADVRAGQRFAVAT